MKNKIKQMKEEIENAKHYSGLKRGIEDEAYNKGYADGLRQAIKIL